jgi:hypothetical protein
MIGTTANYSANIACNVVTETNPGVVSADDDFGQRPTGADLE